GIRDFHVTGVQTCALPIYDGDFDEPETTLPGSEAHLYLECIAVRVNSAQVNGFEHLPAKTLEAACRVGQRETGDPSRVAVREVRSEERRAGNDCREGHGTL